MDIIIDNLPAIITLLLGVTLIWGRVSKLLAVIKEVQELCTVLLAALADKKLTQEEMDAILKEARDIGPALKALLRKKTD